MAQQHINMEELRESLKIAEQLAQLSLEKSSNNNEKPAKFIEDYRAGTSTGDQEIFTKSPGGKMSFVTSLENNHKAHIFNYGNDASAEKSIDDGSDRKFDDNFGSEEKRDDSKAYVPPKQLLLYMTRMGSFTSRQQIASCTTTDDVVQPPEGINHDEFLEWIRKPISHLPHQLDRSYRSVIRSQCNGLSKMMQQATTSQSNNVAGNTSSSAMTQRQMHKSSGKPQTTFRLFQWNILAQALGVHADNFVKCPPEALKWSTRRYRILEEILSRQPDIICLQEVDHYSLLERVLATRGYKGIFLPKPDSPCIYLPENSGPDGCALFIRTDKFDILEQHTRVLEVWRVQTNQVALLVTLRERTSSKELTVLTTHLKARKSALLAKLRNEQGKALLEFLEEHRNGRPAVLCGDLNAEPSEPVYATLTQASSPCLASAYATVNGGQEPPYSSWKIRGDGEAKNNLDYILYTNQGNSSLDVLGSLDYPTEEALGPDRAPSFTCPSDHFSLVCDFSIPDHDSKDRLELNTNVSSTSSLIENEEAESNFNPDDALHGRDEQLNVNDSYSNNSDGNDGSNSCNDHSRHEEVHQEESEQPSRFLVGELSRGR